MPRKIPEPKLESAKKLSAFEQTSIHFGRPSKQTATNVDARK